MRLTLHAVLLSLVVCGVGCATSYHAGSKEGFSETRLSQDVFQVNFMGNDHTSAERVQDFGLLRAAEVTQENGFKCFAIIREGRTARANERATSGTAQATDPAQTHYAASVPRVGHYMFKRYSRLTIQCFTEKPEGVHVFDAVFLCKSIKTKYQIK